ALRAELQALMSDLYGRTGASQLADQARRSSRAAWERVSLKLPKELRDVFYRHPERRRSPEPVAEQLSHDNSLLRVLAINRRLSSTLDVPAILELAMDSAIELTGAERGFLLLSQGARARRALQVAVARNLDRERLGKSHFKFSQDIAQRVLASGEPVLSIDASSDPRFESSVSIHAMRLRSVVCVPIRAHERVLGALYLDNRFQQGRFREADIVVLAAFADQVAIALHNGRLWAELQQRTEQLEREQGRVRELVAAQARQIDELTDELERERQHLGSLHELGGIVGASSAMTRIRGMIRRVAQSALPVLIQGESGTGKELVAKAIAGQGACGAKPFLAINCAALPHALLESELFGHRKGAFTDAVREHPGVFVAAKGGTLFLDEIGEIPLPLQAKLLRVIQEREVQPVGSDKCVRIDDVRLIFATNRKLSDEVARGLFREDLFYRVSVVEIVVPPLRERLEDVPSLCAALLERIAQRQGEAPRRLSRAALGRLLRYAWPGNVRQLENVLARAVVLSENAEIAAQDIDLPSAAAPALSARSRPELRRAEAEAIREALVRSNYNVCEVSRTLGIPRTSLYRKLRRYELLKSPA
ncbi:MAG TPA: sigma 54-interacting transcriptional regulator, partial [Polyangiaceae bacterium]